jgi:hypothetical protein
MELAGGDELAPNRPLMEIAGEQGDRVVLHGVASSPRE